MENLKDRGPTWMIEVEDGCFKDPHPDDVRDHSMHLAILNIQFCLRHIYNIINWHIAIHTSFELGMIEMYPDFFQSLEPLYECLGRWKTKLDANRPECRRAAND